MRRITKNKRGFTLVEMMLSLAIIAIIFGLTTALMMSINDSFTLTYNLNDASDYAVLYGYGIENSVLAEVSKGSATTWRVNNDSILLFNDTPVFEPSQMKTKQNGNGPLVDKWEIKIGFMVDPANPSLVKYVVFVYDNYYDPTKPLMCKYEGSFWLPHSTANISVGHSDDSPDVASLAPGYDNKLVYSTS